MGKMKNLMIDQINQQLNDDTDWDAPELPKESETNELCQKLWEVKSIKDDCIYKLWAYSYEEALRMLPMIESF